jgi:hypothetical protein
LLLPEQDLDFSSEDRKANIHRIFEKSKIMAGASILQLFPSPIKMMIGVWLVACRNRFMPIKMLLFDMELTD